MSQNDLVLSQRGNCLAYAVTCESLKVLNYSKVHGATSFILQYLYFSRAYTNLRQLFVFISISDSFFSSLVIDGIQGIISPSLLLVFPSLYLPIPLRLGAGQNKRSGIRPRALLSWWEMAANTQQAPSPPTPAYDLDLRARLPPAWHDANFQNWAVMRNYKTVEGPIVPCCLRHDRGNVRECGALMPDRDTVHTVAKAILEENSWLIFTIISESNEPYIEMAKEEGLSIVWTKEFAMAIDLAGADPTPVVYEHPELHMEYIQERGFTTINIKKGDTLAATARMMVSQELATVDYVTTEPDFRRRGLASVIMKALTAQAVQEGAKFGMLYATPEGRMLYKALGWKDVYQGLIVGNKETNDMVMAQRAAREAAAATQQEQARAASS